MGGKVFYVRPGLLFVALVPERSEYYFDAAQADHWTFRWVTLQGLCRDLWRILRREHGPVLDLSDAEMSGHSLSSVVNAFESRDAETLEKQSMIIYNHFVISRAILRKEYSAHISDVGRFRAELDKRYRELVSIKQISSTLGSSREHACRKFRAAFGITPSRYLRRKRVENARALLRFGTLSVEEVARRSGFSDSRQLSRAIRSELGMNASDLREQALAAR